MDRGKEDAPKEKYLFVLYSHAKESLFIQIVPV